MKALGGDCCACKRLIICVFRDMGHSVLEVGVGRPAVVAKRGLLYHSVGL